MSMLAYSTESDSAALSFAGLLHACLVCEWNVGSQTYIPPSLGITSFEHPRPFFLPSPFLRASPPADMPRHTSIFLMWNVHGVERQTRYDRARTPQLYHGTFPGTEVLSWALADLVRCQTQTFEHRKAAHCKPSCARAVLWGI